MGKTDCIVHPIDDTLRTQGALDGTMPPIAYEVLKINKPLLITEASVKNALYGCSIQYNAPYAVKVDGAVKSVGYYMQKCNTIQVSKIGK